MVLTDLLGMEVHRQVEDGTGTEHMGKTQWLRRALLDQGFWNEGRKLWAEHKRLEMGIIKYE